MEFGPHLWGFNCISIVACNVIPPSCVKPVFCTQRMMAFYVLFLFHGDGITWQLLFNYNFYILSRLTRHNCHMKIVFPKRLTEMNKYLSLIQ